MTTYGIEVEYLSFGGSCCLYLHPKDGGTDKFAKFLWFLSSYTYLRGSGFKNQSFLVKCEMDKAVLGKIFSEFCIAWFFTHRNYCRHIILYFLYYYSNELIINNRVYRSMSAHKKITGHRVKYLYHTSALFSCNIDFSLFFFPRKVGVADHVVCVSSASINKSPNRFPRKLIWIHAIGGIIHNFSWGVFLRK